MYLETNGQFRTDSLFVERIATRHKKSGNSPVFHLSERKPNGSTVSLYDLFISCADEWDFAMKAFGSKAHLDRLKTIKWFTEGWRGCMTFRGYEAWLEDMAVRDTSIGKAVLIEKARDGDVSAAKKLVDMNKPVHTKGRPKKEDIKREAVKAADERKDIEDDMKRLNVIRLRG